MIKILEDIFNPDKRRDAKRLQIVREAAIAIRQRRAAGEITAEQAHSALMELSTQNRTFIDRVIDW